MPKNIRRMGPAGKQSFQKDVERIRAAINTSGGAGSGSDHGGLTGLDDDDHSQYAHLSQAEIVIGQYTFQPASAQPPFLLHANAQGQLVTGFNADMLEGLEPSSNPGATAAILKTDGSGYFQVERIGLGVTPTAAVHIRDTTQPQLRVEYDVDDYMTFGIDSVADATLQLVSSGAGGSLAFDVDGSIFFDPLGNQVNPVNNYDVNLGQLSKKYLTLHAAELWVETLVAQDTIATIGGRILVGPTTTLTRDLGSSASSIYVKHNQISRSDRLYMETGGNVEFIAALGYTITGVDTTNDWFKIVGDRTGIFTNGVKFTVVGSTGNDGEWTVSSSAYIGGENKTQINVTGDITDPTVDGYILYVGDQTGEEFRYLNVTRNMDGSGANDWYAGDAVFNTGLVGDGFIDLYSYQGVTPGSTNGPTIVGNVRSTLTYNDWTEHWAIGNLKGLYGYGSDTYGAALGKYQDDWIAVDSTNGIRLYSNNTLTGQWLVSGNLILGQVAASKGNIKWENTTDTLKFRSNLTDMMELDLSWGATNRASLRIGEDVSSADTTGFLVGTGTSGAGATAWNNTARGFVVINAGGNNITVNSQTLSAGDLMIGSNATGKPNMFYDHSTGVWAWRQANGTAQVEIQTTGKLTAGGGIVVLDSGGLEIDVTTSWADIRSYKFVDGSTDVGKLQAFLNPTQAEVKLYATAAGVTSVDPEVSIFAVPTAAGINGAIRIGVTNTVTADPTVAFILVREDDTDSNDDGEIFLSSGDIMLQSGGANRCQLRINYGADNTQQNYGITIHQNPSGVNNEALTLKDSDVAHGMTDVTETTTFAFLRGITDASGGLIIRGLTELTRSLVFGGFSISENTATSAAATGGIETNTALKSGSGLTTLGNTGNLFVVQNNGSARFLVKGNGDLKMDGVPGSGGDWDDYDDVALLTGLRSLVTPNLRTRLESNFKDFVDYARPILEESDIVTVNDGQYGNDDDGSVFVSAQGLAYLTIDAVRQLHQKMNLMETALLEAGIEVPQLRGGSR